jgi:biopolymer transport protein ExbB
MEKANAGSSGSGNTLKSLFASLVIVISLVVSALFYVFVLGDPSHFEEGDPANHPIAGDYFGIIHKGGFIVPILIGILLIVIVISVERFITLAKASGKGNLAAFVSKIQNLIKNGKTNEAIAACNQQQGSLANVLRAGLLKVDELESDTTMEKDEKVLVIQREFEEATALELPMLSKNLVIISTLASIATLVGLIGTVLGMIKAFSALAQAGSPDTVALSTGISEALINTALGITGSAIAIIMYNYFSSKIDALTYKIDEAGFSLIQTFAAKHK